MVKNVHLFSTFSDNQNYVTHKYVILPTMFDFANLGSQMWFNSKNILILNSEHRKIDSKWWYANKKTQKLVTITLWYSIKFLWQKVHWAYLPVQAISQDWESTFPVTFKAQVIKYWKKLGRNFFTRKKYLLNNTSLIMI